MFIWHDKQECTSFCFGTWYSYHICCSVAFKGCKMISEFHMCEPNKQIPDTIQEFYNMTHRESSHASISSKYQAISQNKIQNYFYFDFNNF